MRLMVMVVLAVVLAGCASAKKRGVRATDAFESAQVDQMVGNAVSGQVFERTVLCLNARREARPARPATNWVVSIVTNVTVSFVTNQSVTISTNQSRTLATNTVPPLPVTAKEVQVTAPTNETAAVERAVPAESAAAAGQETNQTVVITGPPPSTNDTTTTSSNVSVSRAANQTSATTVAQLLSSRQVTITTNNLSVTTADNQSVSLETNEVVFTITNQTVVPKTNLTVVEADGPQYDYFVSTELAGPSDFTPVASGESLVLLVDGVRYGLSATNVQTGFATRRGFTTAFYRVEPEVIEGIANAGKVRIRLRGVTGVIEKKMSRGSRGNFKKFLLLCAAPVEDGHTRATSRPPEGVRAKRQSS